MSSDTPRQPDPGAAAPTTAHYGTHETAPGNATPARGGHGALQKLKGAANGPLSGIAPWIMMSILAGVTHYEVAVGLALATSLAFVVFNRLTGTKIKVMELADVAFFTVLIIVAAVASTGVTDWLEKWAGEMSNVALVAYATGSILIRRPFTLEYAREETPREMWNHPAFLRTNYVITGFWALMFLVAAVSGYLGDASILGSPNNLWTGWIIQTGAMIVGIQFTVWYPRVVQARARQAAGVPTEPPPPVSELLVSLAGYLPIVGIVSLSFDAAPVWVGIVLIVGGVIATHSTAHDVGQFRKLHAVRAAQQ